MADGVLLYGDGTDSTVGPQIRKESYVKKALVEMAKEEFFGQLGGVLNQPKNMGKAVKKYLYIPIIDDRNTGDGTGTDGVALVGGGNLWGDSRDVGVISGLMPTLPEEAGQANRVSLTREELTGTINKMGIHIVYSEDELNFDTDSELKSHMYTELGKAAREVNERKLQIDLLTNATAQVLVGASTAVNGGTGVVTGADLTSIVDYDALRQMDKKLTKNKAPMRTKIITGSRMIDTKVVSEARYAYCSQESRMMLEDISDNFSNRAWVPVKQYASAGNLAKGEKGSIDNFRFIENLEMTTGTSADAYATPGDLITDAADKLVMHPILFVGGDSFTQIGFQTDGKSVKFVIKSQTPDEAANLNNVYGDTGFYSIKWYYGVLIERPERIGTIYTAVK